MTEETLLEFPCEFPIKIMGRHTAEFHLVARALVEKHTGPIDDTAITSSLSRNGSFVSVTITISAQSKQQLDAIYQDATDHSDVLMAL